MITFFYLFLIQIKDIFRYFLKILRVFYRNFIGSESIQDKYELRWFFYKMKRSNIENSLNSAEITRYSHYLFRTRLEQKYEFRLNVNDHYKPVTEIFFFIRFIKKVYKRKVYIPYERYFRTQKEETKKRNAEHISAIYSGFLKTKNLYRLLIRYNKPVTLNYFSLYISKYFPEIFFICIICVIFFIFFYFFYFINISYFFNFFFKNFVLFDLRDKDSLNIIDDFFFKFNVDLNALINSRKKDIQIFSRGPIKLDLQLSNSAYYQISYSKKFKIPFLMIDEYFLFEAMDEQRPLFFYPRYMPSKLNRDKSFFGLLNNINNEYIVYDRGKSYPFKDETFYKNKDAIMNYIWNDTYLRYIKSKTKFQLYNFLLNKKYGSYIYNIANKNIFYHLDLIIRCYLISPFFEFYNPENKLWPHHKPLFFPALETFLKDQEKKKNGLFSFLKEQEDTKKFVKNYEIDNYYIREYLNIIYEKYSISNFKYDFLIETVVTDSFLSNLFQEKLNILTKFYKKDFNLIYKFFMIQELYFKSYVNIFKYIYENNIEDNLYILDYIDDTSEIIKKTDLNFYNIYYNLINFSKLHKKIIIKNRYLDYELKIFIKLFINYEREKILNRFDVFNYLNRNLNTLYLFYKNSNCQKHINENFFVEHMVDFSLLEKINILYSKHTINDFKYTRNFYDLVKNFIIANEKVNKERIINQFFNFYDLYKKGSKEGFRTDSFIYYFYYNFVKKFSFPTKDIEPSELRKFRFLENNVRLLLHDFGNINPFLNQLTDIESPRYIKYESIFTDKNLFLSNLFLNFKIQVPDIIIHDLYVVLYEYSLAFKKLNRIVNIIEKNNIKIYKNLFHNKYRNPIYLNNRILMKLNLGYFHLSYKLSNDIAEIKYLYKDLYKYFYVNFKEITEFKFFLNYKIIFSSLVLNIADRSYKFFNFENINIYDYKYYFQKFFFDDYIIKEKKKKFYTQNYLKENVINFFNNQSIFYNNYVYHQNHYIYGKNINSAKSISDKYRRSLKYMVETTLKLRLWEQIFKEKRQNEVKYTNFLNKKNQEVFTNKQHIYFYVPTSAVMEQNEITDKVLNSPQLDTLFIDYIINTTNVNDIFKIAQFYDYKTSGIEQAYFSTKGHFFTEILWNAKPFIADKIYKSEILLNNYWLKGSYVVRFPACSKLLRFSLYTIYDFTQEEWKWFFKEDNSFYKGLLLMLFSKKYNLDKDFRNYCIYEKQHDIFSFKYFFQLKNIYKVYLSLNKNNLKPFFFSNIGQDLLFYLNLSDIPNSSENFILWNYKYIKFNENNIMSYHFNKNYLDNIF